MTTMRSLIALPLLLASLLISCHEPVAAAAAGPNVVLIVVDTLRADHLASYGYGLPTDAPLAQLLAQSTRFSDCLAPASWTVPSTASIMTGLHPLHHGVYKHGTELPADAFTMAEAMANRGFRTAGFSHNHNVSALTGFDQGFDSFEAFDGDATAYPDLSLMTREATRWLEQEVSGRFFLYMQPMNVHGPYMVPEEHQADLLGRAPSPGFAYYGSTMRGILKKGETERRDRVSPAMRTSLVEQYDTAVRYTLGELAEFLAELDDLGYYDSSYVIITADHGEELFEHGGFSHGYSLHDEVLHVPLIVKRPFQRSSAVVDEPVTLQDIFPTLVEELSLPIPAPLDGLSLSPLLNDPTTQLPPRDRVAHVDWKKRCVAQAVQLGELKWIQVDRDYADRQGVTELFDLRTDPGELADVSGHKGEEAQLLSELLERRLKEWQELAPDDVRSVLDDMDVETLKALGYL